MRQGVGEVVRKAPRTKPLEALLAQARGRQRELEEMLRLVPPHLSEYDCLLERLDAALAAGERLRRQLARG